MLSVPRDVFVHLLCYTGYHNEHEYELYENNFAEFADRCVAMQLYCTCKDFEWLETLYYSLYGSFRESYGYYTVNLFGKPVGPSYELKFQLDSDSFDVTYIDYSEQSECDIIIGSEHIYDELSTLDSEFKKWIAEHVSKDHCFDKTLLVRTKLPLGRPQPRGEKQYYIEYYSDPDTL